MSSLFKLIKVEYTEEMLTKLSNTASSEEEEEELIAEAKSGKLAADKKVNELFCSTTKTLVLMPSTLQEVASEAGGPERRVIAVVSAKKTLVLS
jgi:hypothetical protein